MSPVSPRGLAVLLLAAVVVVVCPRVARAQHRPELTMRVDASTVGVGDELHVMLKATSQDGTPSDPRLGATPGFRVLGGSSSPSTVINIVNGRMTQSSGIDTTWTLHADKVGLFTLGPASVLEGGQRYSGGTVEVRVVPAGQAPPRRQAFDPFGSGSPFGSPFPSPFDPFRGLFDFPGNQGQQAMPEIPTDPRFALDAPRGTVAFLHATLDKTQAVVGEQVTLSVFLYFDLSEREPDLSDVHEAGASDFLKRSIFEDDAANRPVGNGLVQGRPWSVRMVRRAALFPLKTGDLTIEPMSLTLGRIRLSGDPKRLSETLHVRVTEPPLLGRPPGYVMGDVGNFSLSAEATPRDVEREGAIGVTVELSGTGNLPQSLPLPTRAGIEWLTPEVHEKTGATQGDRFGGKRTFSYVVRFHREGDVDLGDLSLPFFDPDAKTYGVARATLGRVHVRPGAAPASDQVSFDPFADMPAVQTGLAGAKGSRSHVTDRAGFWLGLGGAPLAYFVVSGAWVAARGLRRRRAERKASPETELKERILAAERACAKGDTKSVYAAIVRALESATIARAGVNVRDAQSGEIARRLESQGVGKQTAVQFEELLRACETARFSLDPLDAGGEPLSLARAQWEEAKQAIVSMKRASS
jgi:hypothetical protein